MNNKQFETRLKQNIKNELIEEFKIIQSYGFKRTYQDFNRELHKRYKNMGLQSSYTSIFVKF